MFNQVGTYQIEVAISPLSTLKEPFQYRIDGNEATLILSVTPPDKNALRSVCADLLSRAQDLQSASSALTAARALSSVEDPIAVPYLAKVAQRGPFASLMIKTLARIKTDAAIGALVEASRSNNAEISSLAEAALMNLGKAEKK